MADNKITIDIEVNGKMQKATLSTKKLRKQLDELEGTQDKVTKGASNLSRNMQGASKRTANTTKEFSKLQQGMGGVVGIYATIAAQVFAVSAAFQFLKSASDVSNLIAGQEALGAVSGVAYKTLTAGIREATAGQLSFAEASRAAAIGTASGLSPDQLNGLANAAKNASVALGRDLTDSFNRLIRGTTKAEPELLDELGIILRLDTALGKYAQQLGKNANELSAFERSQAVANEVLEQANNKFGALEKNLDPGIFALNQFLNSFDELINTFKSGVIDVLRPVFIFLSQNTGALTASLALFALPIIKSIVPNLEKWREAAQETLKTQQGKYKELSKEAKSYTLDLDNLGKKEKQIRAEADKLAKKAGGPTDTSAQGGLAFLQGKESAQTATGMKNADKILKTAEAQLADSTKRRSGKLAHMNAEQVADMRRSYELRARILKKHNIQDAGIMKQIELRAKLTSAKIEGFFTKMGAAVSKASIAMSRVMNAAFAATGIIGFAFLIKDLGGMMLDAFIPGRKELKKLQGAVDDTKEKYETLADELNRVNNAMRDPSINLTTRMQQLGNAVNSANIPQLLADFKELERQEKAGANVDELRLNLENTLKSIGRVSPKTEELTRKVLEGGLGARAARQELLNYNNTLIEAAAASKQLADSQRAAQEELNKLMEASKPTTILDGFNARMKANDELAQAEMKGLKEAEDGNRSRLNDLLAQQKVLLSNMEITKQTLPGHQEVEGYDPAQVSRANQLQDDIDAQMEIIKADSLALRIAEEKNAAQTEYVRILGEASDKAEEGYNLAVTQEREANALRNAGISLEGKLLNLRAAEGKSQAKLTKLRTAETELAELLELASQSQNEEIQRMLPHLQLALGTMSAQAEAAQTDLDIAKEKNAIQRQILPLQKEIADLATGQKVIEGAKQLLSIEQKRLGTIKGISDAQMDDAKRQIDLEAQRRSVGNPFFDEEQFKRRELIELEKNTLEERINLARLESSIKIKQIEQEAKLQDIKRKQTILELKQFRAQEVARLDSNEQYQEALDTFESISGLITDMEGLNFQEAANDAIRLEQTLLKVEERKMRGVVDGLEIAEEKASAMNQVLGTAGEAFRDGLGDAIGATFDVITGKTSSLKDALAGIAQDVLQTVQDKFIEEMFVRPIMESGFFGDQKKDFTPEQIAQTAQQGVQDGVTAGGKALATEIKTAAEGVAEVIKEGGRLAGEQIQSSGCLNLCSEQQTVSQKTGMDTGEVTTATIPEETVKSADVLQEITVPPREKKKDADGNVIPDSTDGNEGKSPLDGLKSVLGENIAATGLLVGTVLGNTTIGEKIQKVSAALLAIDMIMKILAKLGLISEKANTTALIANTAATLKAAATNLFFKDGGLVSDKVSAYNTGGIAKGPRSGYPAVLHGNEAVVPLPDGRTIPVTMQGGGGGQQNNVTVNVNVDNEGGASSSVSQTDGRAATELGTLVAVAVQKELQNQKRSGGILSPYGVAS